jgi:hypothetical protein
MKRTRYLVLDRSTQVESECPEGRESAYFKLILNLTGLDRAFATMLLRSGESIEHPAYVFRSVTQDARRA